MNQAGRAVDPRIGGPPGFVVSGVRTVCSVTVGGPRAPTDGGRGVVALVRAKVLDGPDRDALSSVEWQQRHDQCRRRLEAMNPADRQVWTVDWLPRREQLREATMRVVT
ncbi:MULTISPECIES: hypothetical protein [Actinoalloteichus]|uniref:Uncharacterized protein n=1 Tax=Actinoalloteichus fjordicus TaxID=1612552 RepID=A0AAC9LB05_9PSEU|nr:MULTISPECIES: hypothetical protein [Actinoalloteichus]APU13049.1 hypothetical protein UA74_04850 [Actinoalloteichus fjordicus]APU19022.1 hypothetical protein UA75_04965 [Actinoalloteichus sp. GBA129-24]